MFFKESKLAKRTEIVQPPVFPVSPPTSVLRLMHHAVWLARLGSGCAAPPFTLPPPSPAKTGDEAHDERRAKSELQPC